MDLECPSASNKHTTNHIDQSDNQSQETTPVLSDGEQNGLDVEFHKDTRDLALVDNVTLFGDGVLICENCAACEFALAGFIGRGEGHGAFADAG